MASALAAAGTALYLAGGVGLPRPDIDGRVGSDRPAISSPLLAETLREER